MRVSSSNSPMTSVLTIEVAVAAQRLALHIYFGHFTPEYGNISHCETKFIRRKLNMKTHTLLICRYFLNITVPEMPVFPTDRLYLGSQLVNFHSHRTMFKCQTEVLISQNILSAFLVYKEHPYTTWRDMYSTLMKTGCPNKFCV